MSYGFQSISDSGYVQIDENFSNHVLIQSGTVTVNQPSVGTTTVYFSAQSERPLVLVRLPTGATLIGCNVLTDSFTMWTKPGAASFTCEYKVYAKTTYSTATDGYSLQVYNQLNKLVFDGSREHLRLVAYSQVANVNKNYTVTIPSPGFKPWVYANEIGWAGADGYKLYNWAITQNSDNSVTYLNTLDKDSPPPFSFSPVWFGYSKVIIFGK